MVPRNIAQDHIAVGLRRKFGEFIAHPDNHIQVFKDPQTPDTIFVSGYFNTDLPLDQLALQIGHAAETIIKAHFPGIATVEIPENQPPLLKFEGRELLEMLVEFGVRFDGWENYKTETMLHGKPLKKLMR